MLSLYMNVERNICMHYHVATWDVFGRALLGSYEG